MKAHRQTTQDDEEHAHTDNRASKGMVKVRLLITGEDEHRVYREALGRAIKEFRPHLEVIVSRFGEFEAKLERLEPQVVICGRSHPAEPGNGMPAWIALSLDPNQPTNIRVGENRWEVGNPDLKDLLSVIDRVEGQICSEEHP